MSGIFQGDVGLNMHHMVIYLQQLQRCISGLFLVKRAAHQLEVVLGYLQRKKLC